MSVANDTVEPIGNEDTEDNSTNFTPGAFHEWYSTLAPIGVTALGAAEAAWIECAKRAAKYIADLITN